MRQIWTYPATCHLLTHSGKWPIFTRSNNLPPPRVHPQGSVKDSLIGSGCVIKGNVINSILTAGVTVEEQATLRNSIVMANTTIGKYSQVDHCVLDEEVSIGELCYIGFGSNLSVDKHDITVLGRGVTVPSYTGIGHSSKVLPNVGPLDFAASAIPAGAVVSHR